jgi:hypothetical protein
MVRLACGLIALLFLLLALFPFPAPQPLHADPAGANDVYLSSVLSASSGNATPTPTVAPTNTPTGIVEILDNHSWYYSDLLDEYIVVGEVQNGTGDPIDLINLRVTFYDSTNTPVFNRTGFVFGEQIIPNEKACFRLRAEGFDGEWSRYELTDLTYDQYPDNVPLLTVFNVTGEVVPYQNYEEYELRGTVRNSTMSEVGLVDLVGTLYNANGEVADCFFVWEYDLRPGDFASFTLEYDTRTVYSGIVDSFKLLTTASYEFRAPRSPEAEAMYQEYRIQMEQERQLQEP